MDPTHTVDYYANVQFKSRTWSYGSGFMAAALCSEAVNMIDGFIAARNKSDLCDPTADAEEGKGEEE